MQAAAGTLPPEQAIARTAIPTPSALKKFLHDNGTRYVVFDTEDLVDSLSWPQGIETFMGVVDCYRKHREACPTGESRTIKGADGKEQTVPVMKRETPSLAEIEQICRWIAGQARSMQADWQWPTLPTANA